MARLAEAAAAKRSGGVAAAERKVRPGSLDHRGSSEAHRNVLVGGRGYHLAAAAMDMEDDGEDEDAVSAVPTEGGDMVGGGDEHARGSGPEDDEDENDDAMITAMGSDAGDAAVGTSSVSLAAQALGLEEPGHDQGRIGLPDTGADLHGGDPVLSLAEGDGGADSYGAAGSDGSFTAASTWMHTSS